MTQAPTNALFNAGAAATQTVPQKHEPSEDLRRILEQSDLDRILKAESTVRRLTPKALDAMGVLERSLMVADGLYTISEAITPKVLGHLRPLIGSSLGFKCDKQYTDDIISKCITDALVLGVMPVGNEFNIISGKVYVTREGFTRLLREYPGLTDLRIEYDVPIARGDKGATVGFKASWRLGDVSDSLDGTVPVKGEGADLILGKADRKVRARIYARITGSTFTTDGEIDDDTPPPATDKPRNGRTADELNATLAAKTTPPANTSPAAPAESGQTQTGSPATTVPAAPSGPIPRDQTASSSAQGATGSGTSGSAAAKQGKSTGDVDAKPPWEK